MQRIADVRWTTPPPTGVDEELAVYDDGSAWLAVRVPRSGGPTVGSFTGRPDAGAAAELAAAGSVEVDLLSPVPPAVAGLADTLARELREAPHATVTMSAATRSGIGALTLFAVGAGTAPVRFELDVTRCAVLFNHGEQLVAWAEMPALPSGFVTPLAVGLGGVGHPAEIEPGGYGAIAFEVAPPAGATEVVVQAAGWLLASLPDVDTPTPFEVRTDPVPLQDGG